MMYGDDAVRAVLAGRAIEDIDNVSKSLRTELLRRLRAEGLPPHPDGIDVSDAPLNPGYLLFRLRKYIPNHELIPGQGRINERLEDIHGLWWVLYRELTDREWRARQPELPNVLHVVFAILPNDEFLQRGGHEGFVFDDDTSTVGFVWQP